LLVWQTEWELRGLESGYVLAIFDLGVRGSLYADRSHRASRMKGHLEIGITCVLPPVLRIMLETVPRGAAESVSGTRLKLSPPHAVSFLVALFLR
jgi:hypothetical protein